MEAKRYRKHKAEGLQQAKEYAEILGLKFAYATNGREIVEYDYLTGLETEVDAFPTPDELWQRLKERENINESTGKTSPRAISCTKATKGHVTTRKLRLTALCKRYRKGRRRILLTMATGTGKTFVAFQICWKLWNSRWKSTGRVGKPRMLFLADRSVLVDDPKDKTFVPFGDARYKIEGGDVSKGREMYFATYQAIAEDEQRPGLYREYAPHFFDLIIVDEAHRGSAHDDSNWRSILEYFEPAYQLGLTATPLQEENRNTYEYFGNPGISI